MTHGGANATKQKPGCATCTCSRRMLFDDRMTRRDTTHAALLQRTGHLLCTSSSSALDAYSVRTFRGLACFPFAPELPATKSTNDLQNVNFPDTYNR